ncbi:hypothetical protein [Aliivibrio logei]|jgi:SPX domain protein involved in polyphosphate accumulation|uniref:hypothetical protein n=1 Tax=Aliivibrio logei TaxID=688 RepID=UPI0035C8D3E3
MNKVTNFPTARFGNRGNDNGGSDLEVRVAKLESDVNHIRSDISDIKTDIKELRNNQRTDFSYIVWRYDFCSSGFSKFNG